MNKTIGQILKQIRNEKGMTQEQVAEKAGINEKYLGEIERGLKKKPSAFVLDRISSALEVPVCKLLQSKNCLCARNEISSDFVKLLMNRRDKELKKAIRILKILFE